MAMQGVLAHPHAHQNSAVQKLCGLTEDSKWRREGPAKKKLEENGIGALWIRHLKQVVGK